MGLGTIMGAVHGARHAGKGRTCKCPRCGRKRDGCTKACYNYKCPRCHCSLVLTRSR